MKKLKVKEGSVLLQVYMIPFYFLIYMMFIRDPIKSNIWKEVDFNKTFQYKSLKEVEDILGEPDLFQIRDGLIILDYNDLVYAKHKVIRYQFVRLIFYQNRYTVLLPQNIYYKK